jgi:hypothetical protein
MGGHEITIDFDDVSFGRSHGFMDVHKSIFARVSIKKCVFYAYRILYMVLVHLKIMRISLDNKNRKLI